MKVPSAIQEEISLEPVSVKLPASLVSHKAEYSLFRGTVPVDRDIFRQYRRSPKPHSSHRRCRFFRKGLDRPSLL